MMNNEHSAPARSQKLNSQGSTGPRSPAGKTKVSMNALKHGLTARDVVLPGENSDDFEFFRADLMTSLDPRDALESAWAEKIAIDFWRLRRVPRFEALLYRYGSAKFAARQAEEQVIKYESTERDRVLASLEKKKVAARNRHAHKDAEETLAHERAQLDDPAFNLARVLETFLEPFRNLRRHESAVGRSLLISMHELERLQAKRVGKEVPVPAVVDVSVNISEPAGVALEGTNLNEEIDRNHQ
jgi:hypothetical protein